jgi:hypothetical protein
MSFWCNACGQNPCTGECGLPCEHGISKREFCYGCHFSDLVEEATAARERHKKYLQERQLSDNMKKEIEKLKDPVEWEKLFDIAYDGERRSKRKDDE